MTFSNCVLSIFAVVSSSSSFKTRFTSSPMIPRINDSMSPRIELMFSALLSSACSREKLNSLLFKSAPFFAALTSLSIISVSSTRPSSARPRFKNCRFPMITVSRLLKSCATPPVMRPMASIFCDCRSFDSISIWLVMSMKLTTAPMRLLSSMIGLQKNCTGMMGSSLPQKTPVALCTD